ncbi:hypothetical protein JVU11DRAFT_10710 [Chiua virens]|nr:hypothetical protein JVU11DRAFT_10710 [Chiua virens]
MIDTVHHHRPTLKQQNKSFKSKHATKSSLKELAKGRTQRPSPKSPAVSTTAQARLNRRNTQKQAQAAKRAALVTSTRIFNGVDGAPRIVAVIPLCEDVRTVDAVLALATSITEDVEDISQNLPTWKMRRHYNSFPSDMVDIGKALDAAKAADYVLFLLSPSVEVPEASDTLLRSLQAQGLPTVVSAIPPDPLASSLDQKARGAILKSYSLSCNISIPRRLGYMIYLRLPESLSALRSLAEGRPGEVRWRSDRTWIVGDRVEWEDGTVEGDWHRREEGMEDVEVPDAKKGTTPKRIKRIPKNMSEYQAAWIADETDDEDGNEDESNDGQGDGIVEDEIVLIEEGMEIEARGRAVVAFQDLDAEEEEKQLQDWRDRAQEERDAQEFPDEIDTPRDTPVATRFARTMLGYSKFEEFKRTERDVFRAAEAEGVEPGSKVTVHIEGVPREASDSSHGPIVLYGLLKHEHKKTVLHFTVQRNTEYSGSVKSKDPLIICYGPRRLRVNPIYSQHTRGGGKGANNVHKFERFLWHGTTLVASIYAPCGIRQAALYPLTGVGERTR